MRRTRAESRAALRAAKAVLDRIGGYPAPVRIDRVRIAVVPVVFRLPGMRRFDGWAAWSLILLRRPIDSDPSLIVHELCHVWQMQHHPIRMPLSYLTSGYSGNRFEIEARNAAQTGLSGRRSPEQLPR